MLVAEKDNFGRMLFASMDYFVLLVVPDFEVLATERHKDVLKLVLLEDRVDRASL